MDQVTHEMLMTMVTAISSGILLIVLSRRLNISAIVLLLLGGVLGGLFMMLSGPAEDFRNELIVLNNVNFYLFYSLIFLKIFDFRITQFNDK